MHPLYEQLAERYADIQHTPIPDYAPQPEIEDSHRTPQDYIEWMRQVGELRIGSTLHLFTCLKPAAQVIPDARHHGLSHVLIFGGDSNGNYVGFTTAFETWYVVNIVGNLKLIVQAQPKMSFTTYIQTLVNADAPQPDAELPLWNRLGELNRWYIAGTCVIFLLVLAVVLYQINAWQEVAS